MELQHPTHFVNDLLVRLLKDRKGKYIKRKGNNSFSSNSSMGGFIADYFTVNTFDMEYFALI
jgi:hypothetical protein